MVGYFVLYFGYETLARQLHTHVLDPPVAHWVGGGRDGYKHVYVGLVFDS